MENVGVFEDCKELKRVTIPNSVCVIGYDAFGGCTGLTSILIPDSVTTLGDYAFRGCSGLASLSIPESVTTLGYRTFGGCTGITELYIPASVRDLQELCFRRLVCFPIHPLRGGEQTGWMGRWLEKRLQCESVLRRS